jgi:hypothetical protein
LNCAVSGIGTINTVFLQLNGYIIETSAFDVGAVVSFPKRFTMHFYLNCQGCLLHAELPCYVYVCGTLLRRLKKKNTHVNAKVISGIEVRC